MHRSLLVLVVLSFFGLVARSDANEATLWVCHGPTGGALGAAPLNRSDPGCDAPGTAVRTDDVSLYAPAGLVAVRLGRTAGPGYFAQADGVDLERAGTGTLDGEFSGPASGRSLQLGGASFDFRSAALTVDDTARPVVAVGGLTNPARGTLILDIHATDVGVGLASASVAVDGRTVGRADFGVCAELSPADATIDRAFGGDCPATGRVTLPVDTTAVSEGDHTLSVHILDGAGNAALLPAWGITVSNAPVPTATPISIGGTPTPTPTPRVARTPVPTPSPSPSLAPLPAVPPTPTPTVVRTFTTRDFLVIPANPKVKHGALTLSARCPLSTTCALRVSLRRSGRTLAGGSVTVAPGASGRVALTLTKAAQASLKRRKALDVRLTVAGYAGVVIRTR